MKRFDYVLLSMIPVAVAMIVAGTLALGAALSYRDAGPTIRPQTQAAIELPAVPLSHHR